MIASNRDIHIVSIMKYFIKILQRLMTMLPLSHVLLILLLLAMLITRTNLFQSISHPPINQVNVSQLLECQPGSVWSWSLSPPPPETHRDLWPAPHNHLSIMSWAGAGGGHQSHQSRWVWWSNNRWVSVFCQLWYFYQIQCSLFALNRFELRIINTMLQKYVDSI